MKNILLIAIFIFTSTIAKCQISANIIDFNDVKINNISLLDIQKTLGNPLKMEILFGKPLKKIIDPDGDFYSYDFVGFHIGFSAMVAGATHEKPLIGGFDIINNKSSISIKGKIVTIGDSINKLGTVIFSTTTKGSKSIVYQECDGCNNYISIQFDQNTLKITKIYYIEMT